MRALFRPGGGGNRLEKGAVYSQNDASFHPFTASIAGQVCPRPLLRSWSSLTVHRGGAYFYPEIKGLFERPKGGSHGQIIPRYLEGYIEVPPSDPKHYLNCSCGGGVL